METVDIEDSISGIQIGVGGDARRNIGDAYRFSYWLTFVVLVTGFVEKFKGIVVEVAKDLSSNRFLEPVDEIGSPWTSEIGSRPKNYS